MIIEVFSKFGTVLLAGYLFWLGWANLGPRKPEIGAVRQELADQAIAEVVENVRQNRGETQDVVLIHFVNDSTDYFTKQLRSVIEQHGVLILRDWTFAEKLRDKCNLEQPSCATINKAVNIARSRRAGQVLFGKLTVFESYADGANIEVEYTLADCTSGNAIYSGTYTNDVSGSMLASMVPAALEEAIKNTPWLRRILGWLIIVLLLPVFTVSFIRGMVAERSNKTNAFVLSIYTLADALLAWLLAGAAVTSGLSTLVLVLAVATAVAYNIRIMTLAVRLEEA